MPKYVTFDMMTWKAGNHYTPLLCPFAPVCIDVHIVCRPWHFVYRALCHWPDRPQYADLPTMPYVCAISVLWFSSDTPVFVDNTFTKGQWKMRYHLGAYIWATASYIYLPISTKSDASVPWGKKGTPLAHFWQQLDEKHSPRIFVIPIVITCSRLPLWTRGRKAQQ